MVGTLTLTNINGALLVKKCSTCHGQNLNVLAEKAFCYSCGSYVEIEEILRLVGEIAHDDKATSVTISGGACDKVLRFEVPLLQLYKESVILTRVRLSEVTVEGSFRIDSTGQVIGFQAALQGTT